MKNNNLNMLVRASIVSNKILSCFFCFFVMLSTVLMMLSVNIIIPLSDNIQTKIINHITNREIYDTYRGKTDEQTIKNDIKKIKKLDHVEDIYLMPYSLTVSETSGVYFSQHMLDCFHNGYEPTITAGRNFKKGDDKVALVPQMMKDFNESENQINEIDGKSLIGKTLAFSDENQNKINVKVIGAYRTVDPIFSGDEIIIPRTTLIAYNNRVKNNSDIPSSVSDEKEYKILVDDAKNVERVLNEASEITYVSKANPIVDASSYSVAMMILLAISALFAVMVILGIYMFLKNNISSRIDEIALYRSFGYKSKNIFYVLFTEHLIFGLISIIAGLIITQLLCAFIINGYVYSLVGNSLMEMNVNVTLIPALGFTAVFVLILILISRKSVKISEKTDLTILLRN